MLNRETPTRIIRHNDAMQIFEIADVLDELRSEKHWVHGKRNAYTLVKRDNLSILLVAMRENASTHWHAVEGPISLEVIEGCLKFNTDFESVQLEKGGVVALGEGVRHNVEALEDCAFLLTIAGVKVPVPESYKN